jgi:glycosyltransferase involved in cell wall biosynthesis
MPAQVPVGNLSVKFEISVVIPTHRQCFLDGCLEGLAAQSNTAFEVIVVENGVPAAGTWELVESYRSRLPIRYRHDPRAGLNRARNTGADLAGSEVIALLDDDCRPAPEWLDALVDVHGRADAVVAGGRVCLDFVEAPPGWLVGPFRQFLGSIDWSPVGRPLERGEWLVGANLSFRKSIWIETGGFRPDFGMVGRSPPQLGNDEFEFIQRAAALGGRPPWYSPEALVSHRIGAARTGVEWFEWRAYGQGHSDVASLRLREPEAGVHRLYVELDRWAGRFLQEQARRQSVSGNYERDIEFKDNLLRCRIAQLHGMFDAIRFTRRRFAACAAAPDAYRRGVSAIRRLSRMPSPRSHALFELTRRKMRNRTMEPGGDNLPDAWLSELAGMRDESVAWMARASAVHQSAPWGRSIHG